jgi:serine/threonine protein kinase
MMEPLTPQQPETPEQPQTPQVASSSPQAKFIIPPTVGEAITTTVTRNTYTMGEKIGEGFHGEVYRCVDVWNNDLAAKVLKPLFSYDEVKAAAEAELDKLFALRHPNITYVYDAFEYRDTFYIITERCSLSIAQLLQTDWFHGRFWLMPVARSLLQAVHFIHFNNFVHQDIHSGNVFTLTPRDEMAVADADVPAATQFRLGDLGVAKLLTEVDVKDRRAQWMLPPEVIDPAEFGPLDHRIDIYHCGLLFLQLAYSKELRFSADEIRAGKPREMALQLPIPLNFALEKALRRRVPYRTESAMELWRDLKSPVSESEQSAPAIPEFTEPKA